MKINHSDIKFEKKIGRGGYGEVYKGKFNGKDVAIKKLLDHKDLSAAAKTEFENEANMMNHCQHQNIVKSNSCLGLFFTY
jgi:serine/threonine protein kinase